MASSDMIVFDSIASSNLPRPAKSSIMEWYDQATGGRGSSFLATKSRNYAERFVGSKHSELREGAESALTGLVLGAVSQARAEGLNAKVGGFSVPMDLVASVIGIGASVALGAKSSIGQDANAIGNSALTVFAFRQGAQLTKKLGFAATTVAAPARVAGEGDIDPIVAAARNL